LSRVAKNKRLAENFPNRGDEISDYRNPKGARLFAKPAFCIIAAEKQCVAPSLVVYRVTKWEN
jgi:hypothetical protein